MPPELAGFSGEKGADDNWHAVLRRWARNSLTQGRKDLLDTALPMFEQVLIETALEHTGGRRQEAARLLGWGRNTLTRKIKELGMDPDGPAGEYGEASVGAPT